MNGDSGGTSDKIQSIVSWTCRNDFSGLSGDTHLLWILQVVNDRTRKEQLKIFAYGEVAEWPIVQHWKCCVRVTGPGVRIPPLSAQLNTPESRPCDSGVRARPRCRERTSFVAEKFPDLPL